jgi:cellulose synthase/poly-beta-1,6-N-acetylglucosamine synthase-like glycosyltransferase
VDLSTIAAAVLTVVLGMWLLLLSGWLFYNLWLMWLAWRLRDAAPVRPPLPATLPRVTVQLPVYNEEAVVARLLAAVGQLEWPSELLQIQLLDDSTDDTPRIAADAIAELRARGLDVSHVRRTVRSGYKAGALEAALPSATGEFILILDADFVPAPDLLTRLIPWFNDPGIAMVQARWGPLAPAARLIERTVGYWIERHFAIEQVARSRSGQFFHFNGSGGIWRRSVIAEAGGWSADTLAEDLDLSLRAWLRGWRFIYDHEVIVPAEIPASAAALRIQQSRWSRGAFQMARKALASLGRASWRDRVTVMLQVTGYSFPILMLSLAVTAGPAAWASGYHPLLGRLAFDVPMLGFCLALIVTVLLIGIMGGWRRGWLEVEAAAMGMALAPLLLQAGVAGLRRFGGEFKRTPKSARAERATPPIVFVEAGIGGAALASATFAVSAGAPWGALLPLLAGVGLLTFAWRTVRP